MTSRDFCYWLQGVFEVGQVTQLSEEQVKLIKQHLSMVFIHEIDPSFSPGQQQQLDQAHGTPQQESNRPPNGPMARC